MDKIVCLSYPKKIVVARNNIKHTVHQFFYLFTGMASSDDESRDNNRPRDEGKSLMEEALKILHQEGFTLPDDVVETLHTVGRSNTASRQRGSLRGHRMCEVQSSTRKMRNTRESSGRRPSGGGVNDESEGATNGYSRDRVSRFDQRYGREEMGGASMRAGDFADDEMIKSRLERQESAESSSTCTASTVRERCTPEKFRSPPPSLERQDSDESIASSASSYARKLRGVERLNSGSDTGYNTSIENAKQTHEARAQNLKNYKQMDTKMSKRNGGLRRDLSRDSGFTESGYSSVSNAPPQTVVPTKNKPEPNTTSTNDFNDFSVSDSDVKERYVSTDAGDAHTVMSTASDLKAAQMTSRSDVVTGDGTAVSSVAKLENQDANSTMLRATSKNTADKMGRDEDYESINKTSKSSRNDSISTNQDGVKTAASRHAASVEQGLYKEESKMEMSKDGKHSSSEMKVDQNLARNQQMNNIEQSDDGSAKEQSKQISDNMLTSKSHREEKMNSDDGSRTGSISATCNLDSRAKTSNNEEIVTQPDGTQVKKNNSSTTKTENQDNSSERTTVKREPYTGASSTEITRKSDKSSVSESSKKISEVKDTPMGRSTIEESEDSKSTSSNFSGQCESTDVRNGVQHQRKTSSEKSSASSVKSSRSVSSYSSRKNTAEMLEENSAGNRRLSNLSDISNVSNVSGRSRDTISPPTYDETMSSRSRPPSVSSTFSRQDSGGSSIASSASTFNERQRQKMLAKSNMERQDSGENRREYNGDTYGSDSVFSEDFEDSYRGRPRAVNHPIRVDDSRGYSKSVASGRSGNRRTTLQGDLALSERELNIARRDIRSSILHEDDSLFDRRTSGFSSSILDRPTRRDRDVFDSFGTTSFKDEVMGMVDSFFGDDDDDDFGIGFGSRKNTRRSDYKSSSDRVLRREVDNPYVTRDDLSKFREAYDYNAGGSDREYAASETGYPPVARPSTGSSVKSSRYERDEYDVSDCVSESGYGRHARTKTSQSDALDSESSSKYQNTNKYSANQYQRSSEGVTTNTHSTAGDNSRSAGKSIRNDRTSISDRVGLKNERDKTPDRKKTNAGNKYSEHAKSAMDLTDLKSNSGLGKAGSGGRPRLNSDPEGAEDENGDDPEKEAERKQRIGSALHWIRSELVSVFCCLQI